MLAVAAVFLLPTATIATDPRDVGGKLDLRSVKVAREGSLLRVTISTYGPWASKLLQNSGTGHSGPRPGINALTVYYDVNGDGSADFTGRIVYRGKGYDHNWVLNKSGDGLTKAAEVNEPKSGRVMEVLDHRAGAAVLHRQLPRWHAEGQGQDISPSRRLLHGNPALSGFA